VTFLDQELREQPEALARLLDKQHAHALEVAELFRRDDVQYVVIASRGSSSNAALYGQYLFGRAHRVPVAFATPSLYTLYEQPPRLDGALVIGISQSGRSPDVRAVVEEAARQGRPTIALTNDPSSQLERSWADVESVQPLGGGTVVARGVNFGTAYEIALKMRELSGLLFEAYSAADLMHGPVAAIREGWPVLAVAPSGPANASMNEAIESVRARGARMIVLSDQPGAELPLVRVPEWVSPLVSVIPGQLLARRLAELGGADIDRPGGLSKVTLTR